MLWQLDTVVDRLGTDWRIVVVQFAEQVSWGIELWHCTGMAFLDLLHIPLRRSTVLGQGRLRLGSLWVAADTDTGGLGSLSHRQKLELRLAQQLARKKRRQESVEWHNMKQRALAVLQLVGNSSFLTVFFLLFSPLEMAKMLILRTV